MSDHSKPIRKSQTDTNLFQLPHQAHPTHDNCYFHGSFFQQAPTQSRQFKKPSRQFGMPRLPQVFR